MNIKNHKDALTILVNAAIEYAAATESGDYKNGNKNVKRIIQSVSFLRNENELHLLKPLLSHESVGVRLWVARYLLNDFEKECIYTLNEIAQKNGIHSLTAKMTMNEWYKGELDF